MNQPPYGWPPPPQPPRQNNSTMWIILAVGLALIAGGTVLTLWLTGVFGGQSGTNVAGPSAPGPLSSGGPSDGPVDPARAPGGVCPGIVSASALGGAAPPNSNRLVVGPGDDVQWNGTRVDPGTLKQYLEMTMNMRPIPTLVTEEAPGADPQVIQQVLDVIRSGTTCRPASL